MWPWAAWNNVASRGPETHNLFLYSLCNTGTDLPFIFTQTSIRSNQAVGCKAEESWFDSRQGQEHPDRLWGQFNLLFGVWRTLISRGKAAARLALPLTFIRYCGWNFIFINTKQPITPNTVLRLSINVQFCNFVYDWLAQCFSNSVPRNLRIQQKIVRGSERNSGINT
jgi:hypothetical protein